MAYQIVWSKEAITSFDSIIEYLAENFTEKGSRYFSFRNQQEVIVDFADA